MELVSTDEKRAVRYTELEPRRGIKTFHGQGGLRKLAGVEAPLFGMAGMTNMFTGFFEDRFFRIEVVSWGDDPAGTLGEVTALGLQVLKLDKELP